MDGPAAKMSEVTADMIERGRGVTDSAQVQQRRKLASRVRMAREVLTSIGSGQRRFDVELLRLFARNQRHATIAQLFLLVPSALLAADGLRIKFIVFWLLVAAAAILTNNEVCRRYVARVRDDASVAEQRRLMAGLALLQSVIFAAIVVFANMAIGGHSAALAFFLVLLEGALAANLASPLPQALYAWLGPLLLAAATFPLRNPASGLLLFGLCGGALAGFMVLGLRTYRLDLHAIELQQEKDNLISEIDQARQNSEEARRRAEEASLAKSRFLATMSHELRTPLNAILGFSEVMKDEIFGPHSSDSYAEYSRDIHSSGEHLLGLINEILDLSRVEAGRQELNDEALLLAEVAQDCLHLMKIRAAKRDITIVESFEADLPKLWADERALRQIILNLLSNAVKFTPAKGIVTVKIGWTQPGGQYLMVRDNGPGIPEAEIPVVLSTFGRGSAALKDAEEGTGLGLPIVKGLLELHGGTLILRSKLREGTDAIAVFPPDRVIALMPQLDPEAPVPEAVMKATRAA